MVQNTFIHAKLPPPTPLPGARRRTRSVPKNMGMEQVSCIADSDDIASVDGSTRENTCTSRDSCPSTPSSTEGVAMQSLESMMRSIDFDDSYSRNTCGQFCSNEPLTLDYASDSVGSLLTKLQPQLSPNTTEDPDMASRRRVPLCATPLATPGSVTVAKRDPTRKRSVRFAEDESSTTRGRSFTIDSATPAHVQPSPTRTSWPALTPITLSKKGLGVRGTFINALPVPPTPLGKDASHRSHSLPRNMGSEKLCEESQGLLAFGAGQGCTRSSSEVPPTPLMNVFPPTPWPFSSAFQQEPLTPLVSVFPPTPW